MRLFLNSDNNPELSHKILRIFKHFPSEDQTLHICQAHEPKAGEAERFAWCHRRSPESRCPRVPSDPMPESRSVGGACPQQWRKRRPWRFTWCLQHWAGLGPTPLLCFSALQWHLINYTGWFLHLNLKNLTRSVAVAERQRMREGNCQARWVTRCLIFSTPPQPPRLFKAHVGWGWEQLPAHSQDLGPLWMCLLQGPQPGACTKTRSGATQLLPGALAFLVCHKV